MASDETSGPGRPSSYKPEFAHQAEKLCELGATEQELANFFEKNIKTIYRWKIEFPEFCRAIKTGKEVADTRVERSLYHRAVGYEHEAVKIFMPAGASEPVYAPYIERYPPETAAMIFWLKNRKPDVWRDKREMEVDGDKTIRVIVEGGPPAAPEGQKPK
jgi:hypothetical protein